MLIHPTCPRCGGNHGERCPSAPKRWSVTIIADGRFWRRLIVEATSSDDAVVGIMNNLIGQSWPKGMPRFHMECLEIPA